MRQEVIFRSEWTRFTHRTPVSSGVPIVKQPSAFGVTGLGTTGRRTEVGGQRSEIGSVLQCFGRQDSAKARGQKQILQTIMYPPEQFSGSILCHYTRLL